LSVPAQSSDPAVPKDVVVNTRAVLLSCKHGVLLGKFKGDYKKLVGKFIF